MLEKMSLEQKWAYLEKEASELMLRIEQLEKVVKEPPEQSIANEEFEIGESHDKYFRICSRDDGVAVAATQYMRYAKAIAALPELVKAAKKMVKYFQMWDTGSESPATLRYEPVAKLATQLKEALKKAGEM